MQLPRGLASTAEARRSFADAQAFLFDLDGVLTPTAELHMRAWARLFASFFASERAGSQGHPVRDYDSSDYFTHIDGRPRYDGVRAVLASRGIGVPEGSPTDSPEALTICGLGNRKDAEFRAELSENGIAPYPGSLDFLGAAQRAGAVTAVVSSSRNAVPVLAAAGLADRFAVVVDGLVAEREGLAGKPAPDTYLYAAELLGVPADRCAVVEDAVSGVASGRAGAFGLVIGVDRGAGRDSLAVAGADLVVDDLRDLVEEAP